MIAENSTESHSRLQERLVLFILAAVQFTTIVDFMIVMPLGPQLRRTLNINYEQFSFIVSSYTFAAGFSGLIASLIIDRFSRRTTFMVLYAGFLAGTFLCGIAPSYWTLVAARIATGWFGGLLGGMAMTIVGDVFPDERRGRAMGTLMSGFALASVAGVPLGMVLGTEFGWYVPFLVLVVGGLPLLFLTPFAMPALDAHVGKSTAHPIKALFETFTIPNHLNAFALIVTLMIGSFAVFPSVSNYFVANVGLTEKQLPWMYVVGGTFTLIASPIFGRLVDRYGKLTIYRIIAPASAVLFLAITLLPPVHMAVAVAVFAALMVCNVGRMIAAMALITGSVAPHRRGGFLSANSSVQHIACGVAASLAGLIITTDSENRIQHFGIVGWIAALTTLFTLWLAGRIRLAEQTPIHADRLSLAAAAEATVDAGEPMIVAAEDAA